jgi:hypothetical protein
MSRITHLLAPLLILALLTLHSQAAQKNKANARDEQRENAAVKEAQQDLAKAKDNLKDGEKSLREAQAAHRKAELDRKQAASDMQKLRDQLEERHEKETGLLAARRELQRLTTERDRLVDPLVKAVRQRETSLAAELATAEQNLSRATTLDERKTAAKQIADIQARFRILETAAIEADPNARRTAQQAAEQEARVRTAVDKFDRVIERDPQLKAADQRFAAAKKAEDAAGDSLAKATRSVANSRNSVEKAEVKLAQKVAQDRRDRNKK